MGASLVIRDYNYSDRKTLAGLVRQQSDEDAYENGHSYSGGWNMCRGEVRFDESKIFESISAAHTHIEEHQQKWEALLAVPAWDTLEPPADAAKNDATLQKLLEQQREYRQKVWNQDGDIVKRSREAKSKLKGCTNCESRINVAHVHSTRCPVCSSNLLRTPTDDKQLAGFKEKLAVLDEKVKDRRSAIAKKHFKVQDPTRKVWVVGGWCAS